MSEFFLELFSEEIPARLQRSFREKILDDFKTFFNKRSIKFKKSFSLSCPNRVVVVFKGLDKFIKIKSPKKCINQKYLEYPLIFLLFLTNIKI